MQLAMYAMAERKKSDSVFFFLFRSHDHLGEQEGAEARDRRRRGEAS